MEIHIARDQFQYGPYDVATLRELHAGGQVVDTDLAWHAGLDRWVYVAELDPSVLPRAAAPGSGPQLAPSHAAQAGRPILVTGAAGVRGVPSGGAGFRPAAHRPVSPYAGGAGASGPLSVTEVLFGFTGRLSLGQFWGYTVAILGILFVITVAVAITLGPMMAEALPDPADATLDAGGAADSLRPEALGGAALGILIVFAFVGLLVAFCGLALQVKRWHDRDKSGWWVLIGLVPAVGAVWVFVECYCLPGTPGPNRFGPDPRQGREG